MFRNKVKKELSKNPELLIKADKIAERSLRHFIKRLLRDKFEPKKSDFRKPLERFIEHTIRGYIFADKGMIEEATASADEIMRLSQDPQYQERSLLNQATQIADRVAISDIYKFFKECLGTGLEYATTIWSKKIEWSKSRIIGIYGMRVPSSIVSRRKN